MMSAWREDLAKRYGPWLSELQHGIECGDGWEVIVTEMLEQIELTVGSPSEWPELRLAVVRQSFGWLMCHAHGVSEVSDERKIAVTRAFQRATSRSTKTCELCGAPGTQREADIDRDLWTVMCDGCRDGGRHDEDLE